MQILQRDLISRDIEAAAQFVAQATHHRPFLLERLCVRNVDFEKRDCNDHDADRGPRTAARESLRQYGVELLDLERLDDVADLDVLKALDADATLESLTNFGHVVLEVPQ